METILVVENDAATLVARSLILRCFGYGVLEGSSRVEAWGVCHEHRGPIHLILMEASLDGGSDFVTRLQCRYPDIRVLFVSDASSMELDDMPCEYAFVPKPFRADDLANTIRELLSAPETRASVPFSDLRAVNF